MFLAISFIKQTHKLFLESCSWLSWCFPLIPWIPLPFVNTHTPVVHLTPDNKHPGVTVREGGFQATRVRKARLSWEFTFSWKRPFANTDGCDLSICAPAPQSSAGLSQFPWPQPASLGTFLGLSSLLSPTPRLLAFFDSLHSEPLASVRPAESAFWAVNLRILTTYQMRGKRGLKEEATFSQQSSLFHCPGDVGLRCPGWPVCTVKISYSISSPMQSLGLHHA